MGTTFVICLFLATHLHAGSITGFNSVTSISTTANGASPLDISLAPFDVDAELARIAAVCLGSTDYEQLAGNVVRYNFARSLSFVLVEESVVGIGLAELRAALRFSPPRPWRAYNDTEPSEAELQSAPSPEEYYNLREPRSSMSSLNSSYLFEHNVAAGIAYLDERLPSIRTIFRRTFDEKRPPEGAIDKKAIDSMIGEYFAILNRVDKATSEMLSLRRRKCRD